MKTEVPGSLMKSVRRPVGAPERMGTVNAVTGAATLTEPRHGSCPAADTVIWCAPGATSGMIRLPALSTSNFSCPSNSTFAPGGALIIRRAVVAGDEGGDTGLAGVGRGVGLGVGVAAGPAVVARGVGRGIGVAAGRGVGVGVGVAGFFSGFLTVGAGMSRPVGS